MPLAPTNADLRPLVNSEDREDREIGRLTVVGDGATLRVSEAQALLREAGYTDSLNAIRGMADNGILASYTVGVGGHRRIYRSSVEALIAKRQETSGQHQ